VSVPDRGRKAIALLLSGVFPGLGQFYNRQPVKGLAFLVSSAVLSWLAGKALPPDPLVPGAIGAELLGLVCLLLVIWTWSLVDAWRAAR